MEDKTKKRKLDTYTTLANGYGLRPSTPQSRNMTSIYQQNVNGISPMVSEKVPTTPIHTYGSNNSGTANNIVEPAKQQTNSTDYWKQLQQQIKLSNLNTKNELALAQRNASKNMDNYLKALGIYGSGLGQSAYVDLANDYANKIADINAEEREQLTTLAQEKQTQNKQEISEINDLTGDPFALLSRIDEMRASGEDVSNLDAYYKYAMDEARSNVQSLYSTMKKEMNTEEFDGNLELYKTALTMMENAYNSGNVNALKQAYDYAYNVSNRTSNLNSTVTNTGNTNTGNTNTSTNNSDTSDIKTSNNNPYNLQKGMKVTLNGESGKTNPYRYLGLYDTKYNGYGKLSNDVKIEKFDIDSNEVSFTLFGQKITASISDFQKWIEDGKVQLN